MSDEKQTEIKEQKKNNKTLIAVIIAAVVILAVVICGFIFYIHKLDEKNQSNGVSDGIAIDTRAGAMTPEQKALKEREVFFTGFESSKLNHESTIELINLPENEDFLMKYQCINSETGETVYETDLIPSSQSVLWTPYNDLGVGTFTIKFTQVPYYKQENGEYRTLTSASNEVVLEIVD